MGGVGAVMYVEPSTAGDLWPWALTPLTARAVSAFLIGFAAAAAYAAVGQPAGAASPARPTPTPCWERSSCSPPRCSPDDLDGGARTALYVAFTVTVLAVGVAGSLAVRRVQRS